MKPNRTLDWLLAIVPAILSIKFFLEKDLIYGVVWMVVSILYLTYAIKLWKKDKAACQESPAQDDIAQGKAASASAEKGSAGETESLDDMDGQNN